MYQFLTNLNPLWTSDMYQYIKLVIFIFILLWVVLALKGLNYEITLFR